MNTFEAKGILKEYIGHKGDKWEVSMTDEDILLERGEKYKKMNVTLTPRIYNRGRICNVR